MAVAVTLKFPATIEQYDQVNEKLDPANNAPDGLIIHTGAEGDGGIRIFDVWDSAEAFERFRDERLGPAVAEVVGEGDPAGQPEVEIYELHDVFKP